MKDKKEASQPGGNQYFFFSEKKIKKVFDWIFIKGNIYIIADTIASLRKEHLHM